jgi:hypothetical protein
MAKFYTYPETLPGGVEWLDENTPPGKLIEVLWNVGFLRAFMKIGQTPAAVDDSYYVGYHQESTLNIALIRYFDIHLMRKYGLLNLTPLLLKPRYERS